jgi:hypothetical protein
LRDPLPSIDPNSIVDGRTSLGIFYSNDGVTALNGGYQVANTYKTPEYFLYPNQIVASDFEIPSGKSAVIQSNSQIVLKPGFISRGSLVLKVGGYDDNFPLAKKGVRPQISRQRPGLLTNGILKASRNLNELGLTLQIMEPSIVEVDVYASDGKKLGALGKGQQIGTGRQVMQVPLQQSYSGLLFIRVKIGEVFYNRAIAPLL